ncbi:hypothetical protein F4778DRAFT_716151, partial [Xylariomycetidae sp. FL2044]
MDLSILTVLLLCAVLTPTFPLPLDILDKYLCTFQTVTFLSSSEGFIETDTGHRPPPSTRNMRSDSQLDRHFPDSVPTFCFAPFRSVFVIIFFFRWATRIRKTETRRTKGPGLI